MNLVLLNKHMTTLMKLSVELKDTYFLIVHSKK